MKTDANILRTFASRPFVVVDRDTGDILGTSGNNAHACALGASRVGENGYSVVNLGDIDGFCEAATNAADVGGAIVAQYASGRTCREIAVWLREAKHSSFLVGETVADRIRKVVGSLARAKARRQVAAWILEGAVG